MVQVPQEFFKRLERLLDVLRFFCLAVGFVGNFDVKVDAVFSMCQRRLNIDPPCRSNIDPGRVAGV
jgi:hypothetical protein